MKPLRRSADIVASLAVAIFAASCGFGEGSGSKSAAGADPQRGQEASPVILISIDTLRSDRLPVYGYDGVETPALDRFAQDAVVFERAYSHYPLTLPSHMSLLTGRLPASAGVRDNSRYRLEDGVNPYLPEVLSRAGYATAGAVSTFVLRADTGISRGFDDYFDVPLPAPPRPTTSKPRAEPSPPVLQEERAGAETLAKALPWLSAHAGKPFFLLFHIYEPHLPHTPPEPFRTRWGDTYEGEIATADQVVGDLLDDLRRLGVYDDALIFVLSDHGEELGEHGEEGHGLLLYRQSLQVPLMMKLPAPVGAAMRGGRRYPHPVQLADVLPTVLDVLGIEAPGQGQNGRVGESLVGLLERADVAGPDDEPETARPIYSETLYPRIHYGWHELTSLIQGNLHLIAGLHGEVFDLAADPGETQDILSERRREYRSLDEIRSGLATPYARPTEAEDEETQKRLASLGYLSSSGPTGEPTKDPRDVVPEFAPRLKRADDALRAHRDEEAARLYEELVALDDGMPATWQGLGIARMGLDDHTGAFEALAHALRLDPQPLTAQMAARCLLELGRLDEAEEHVQIALEGHEAGSRDLMVIIQVTRGRLDEALRSAAQEGGLETLLPTTLLRLARALAQDRRVEPARRALEVLTRVDPSAVSWNELARLALESGDTAAARQALDRSMALEPRNAGSLEWLGLLELQQGNLDAAKTLLEESIGKDAERSNAWNLLAVARFQLRDAEGALTAWQEAVRLDPSHLDALFNLGLTAARLGRRDVALRALRRYEEAADELPGVDPARAQEQSEVRSMIQRLETR